MNEESKTKPIGKNEIKQLITSLEKPKHLKTEDDMRIILQMLKPTVLMKKHKFKGRELLECLKRF